MASVKEAFGGSTAITCTITSLASAAARQATPIDNTANLYLDALVTVKVKTSASALGTNPNVALYVAFEEDGSTWIDGAGAADSAYTLISPPNIRFIGYIWTPSVSTQYVNVFEIAGKCGGVLPPKWQPIIVNNTGQALDAAVGALTYNGVYQTVI